MKIYLGVSSVFAFFALTLSPTYVFSQSGGIDSAGDCNANITGSGNTVYIRCANKNAVSNDEFVNLVFQSLNVRLIALNFLPSKWVDSVPDFHLFIDQSEILEHSIRLRKGEHTYRMKVELLMTDGETQTVECAGILDIDASAVVKSTMAQYVNRGNGRIRADRCGFTVIDG